MNQISDKAVISPKAKIGNNVKIFPFVYIEDYVEIGDNCTIFPFVSILNGTKMGKDNKVHQGTVIGAFPQDFEFQGERSEVIIGDNNTIRENVIINRRPMRAARPSLATATSSWRAFISPTTPWWAISTSLVMARRSRATAK